MPLRKSWRRRLVQRTRSRGGVILVKLAAERGRPAGWIALTAGQYASGLTSQYEPPVGRPSESIAYARGSRSTRVERHE